MQASPATPPAADAREDYAATFAAWSASLDGASLPPAVAQAAKTNLLDTLACAVAGSNAPGVGDVGALVRSWGGTGQAPIWCSRDRVPAHHAAWINGMMAHARDFDDTHDGAVLHAGVSAVPAALAAAELRPDATGADLLAGVAAGLELTCRLGVATTIGIIDSGFIYSSLFGYFGATAAAARVLRLDARQTVNALGIAYSQAAGTHQVTRDAALTKRMQPGFAAQAALVSVQLAAREIRGAQQTFEGLDGLFRTYLRDRYDPAALRDGLGQRFEFMALGYKPYPCCRFTHTAIDAALALARRPGFDLGRLDRIDAAVNRQAYEAVCTPPETRRRPRTIVQAQFSIPFTVACALVDGRVGLGHFTEAGIGRPDILAVSEKVACAPDPGIERAWSRSISPTSLDARVGGTVLHVRVDHPNGSPHNAMTAAVFDAKLADCLEFSGLDWGSDRGTQLRQAIGRLEGSKAARSLNDLLIPSA